jgi:hypothetical protein
VLSFSEIMENISPDDVRQKIRRFWAISSGKLTGNLDEMYAPTAIVFAGKATRSESAKLMAVRRSRQLPGPGSTAVLT